MPTSSPPIAGPSQDDVAGRTERLATALSGWRPPPEGQTDPGRALIRVFDRMARHILERLNRLPERNYLAFLNLIGVEPASPRPARAPLTFTLVERGDAEPLIPAGTRVGATPMPGDTREIVFETARELATTRSRLVAALVRQPDGDRWADCTATATGQVPGFFPAFGGAQPVEHALLLASEQVLGLPAGTRPTVALAFSSLAELQVWQKLHDPSSLPELVTDAYYRTRAPPPPLVRWSYWSGSGWVPLTYTASVNGTSLLLTFSLPGDLSAVAVNGRTTRWLRAVLTAWPKAPIPKLQGIQLSAPVSRSALAPQLALSGGRPADLSMDFHPLGERPRLNDTFYLASDEVFSRPGASVTVTVTLSPNAAQTLKTTDAPSIAWEVSTSSGWNKLLTTTPTLPPATSTEPPKPPLNDALRTVTLTLPSNVAPAEVNGRRAHWLRIRLAGGSFGKGLEITPTGNASQPLSVVDDGYRPPILSALTLGYSTTLRDTAPVLLLSNDFTFTAPPGGASFAPFIRSPEQRPTLYLGFDRPFAPRNTLLYFQVAPLSANEAAQELAGGGAAPKVSWEYSTATGWAPLGAEDETRGFSQSGLVQFIGPQHFTPRTELGRSNLYWLRLQLAEGQLLVMPRLGHVLTNTVWGTHTATLTGESLGASDGGANQVFTLSHRPVLEGQHLEVLEPELGWVRWHEVPDFYTSGPEDRHYQLDRWTGQVRFGDGQRGKVPPRGVRNVRAAVYRTGGGADGDRPVGVLRQLKTTVPYVDAVTNHEPATGGADRESVSRAQERGPRMLRHGGRALTAEDFEDLAREASPLVARARAITPRFNPIDQANQPTVLAEAGRVVVLLVPSSPQVPPTPSLSLLQDVEAYLRQRCPPAVSLRVVGPDWIPVGTTLTLVPTSLVELEALRFRVRQALEAFLHPLTGGAEGTGWDFGQLPRESDIHRKVASVPGVDSITSLVLSIPPIEAARAARALIHSSAHTLHIVAPQGVR